ncbi:hypothetical protein V1505DRAFT_360866 [Lipomyces doorenjongii]
MGRSSLFRVIYSIHGLADVPSASFLYIYISQYLYMFRDFFVYSLSFNYCYGLLSIDLTACICTIMTFMLRILLVVINSGKFPINI